MGFLLSDSEWDQYANDIDQFMNEDVALQPVEWLQCIRPADLNGDDLEPLYSSTDLQGIITYNQFRTWPINTQTITGDNDKESCLLFMNTKWLEDNDYNNLQGLFAFDPVLDRFIVDGIMYKASGDSKTSQVKSKTLLTFIVLRRESIATGHEKYKVVPNNP